jgi:hypothetical protein
MVDVLTQDCREVALSSDQEVVEAFASAGPTMTMWPLSGRSANTSPEPSGHVESRILGQRARPVRRAGDGKTDSRKAARRSVPTQHTPSNPTRRTCSSNSCPAATNAPRAHTVRSTSRSCCASWPPWCCSSAPHDAAPAGIVRRQARDIPGDHPASERPPAADGPRYGSPKASDSCVSSSRPRHIQIGCHCCMASWSTRSANRTCWHGYRCHRHSCCGCPHHPSRSG